MFRKSKGIDIWPKRNFPKLNFTRSDSHQIEELLTQMFNGGFPVVLSSGRGAIFVASRLFWTKNIIYVFPYASQCVINALQSADLAVATKTDYSADILIDQWGIQDIGCHERFFIEDACDSFLKQGSKVLELNADFEIWSLPKIIGSRFGAVLWCREEESAQKVRKFRDDNSSGNKYLKKLMRFFKNVNKFNYQAWEDLEFRSLGLTNYEYGTLLKNISHWDELYNNRKKYFQKALRTLEANTINEFADFNQKSWNRIPTIIYAKTEMSVDSTTKIKFSQNLHRVKYGSRPEKVQIYNYLQEM